jgi:Uma2 family endonuclease
MVQTERWTEEQIRALPEGFKYEIVDGVLHVTANTFRHSATIANLLMALGAFVLPRGLGRVLGPDIGAWMRAGNFRMPDVCFVSTERLPKPKDFDKFLLEGPDLVVEVLSPSDRPGPAARKAEDYFASGTRLFWLVDPRLRSVKVIQPGQADKTLRLGDVLTGGPVLPGFTLSLEDLFAGL